MAINDSITSINDAIALFIAHRHAAGLKPNTIRTYQIWLDLWQRWRADRSHLLADVSADELRAFISYLRDDYVATHQSPQHAWAGRLGQYSILSAWRTLRALWNCLADEHLLTDEQGTFFSKRVPQPHIEQDIRPTYAPALVERLLAAADSSPTPERDRAIVLLLIESGMRATELAGLQIGDLQLSQRQAKIRGKGGKYRFVFFGPDGARALKRWLAVRPAADHDCVFVGVSSRNQRGPITYETLRMLFRRLAQRARIKLATGASIHATRHSFAHAALDAGIDGLHLQQLMGHADMQTTARYVREHPTKLRNVHRRIFSQQEGE